MQTENRRTAVSLNAVLQRLSGQKGRSAKLLRNYIDVFARQSYLSFLADFSPDVLLRFFRDRLALLESRRGKFSKVNLSPLVNGEGPNGSGFTLIEVFTEDRPFVTDSVQCLLAQAGLAIRAMFHPIMRVERGRDGKINAVRAGSPGEALELHLVLVVEAVPHGEQAALKKQLESVLQDVAQCVGDYPQICAELDGLQSAFGPNPSSRAFMEMLSWLREENFIFLGLIPFAVSRGAGRSRKAKLTPKAGEGLGLFAPQGSASGSTSGSGSGHRKRLLELATAFLESHNGPQPFLAVEQTDVASQVHNNNLISCLPLSPQPLTNRKTAWVIAGLFTNRSQREDVFGVPIIREKAQALLDGLELVADSYKYKETVDFLNGLPKSEMFRMPPPLLKRLAEFALNATDHPRNAAEVLADKSWRSLRVLSALPSAYFPPEQMERIRSRLEALLGCEASSSFVVRLSNISIFGLLFQPLPARWMTNRQQEQVGAAALEMLQSRKVRLLQKTLQGDRNEEEPAKSLLAALPEDYMVAHQDDEVLADLRGLERLVVEQSRQLDLRETGDDNSVNIVLYDRVFSSLSRIMPVFTNLRLHVVEEKAFEFDWKSGPCHIQNFQVRPVSGKAIDPARALPRLRPLLFGILDDKLENDPLNALLFACDFDWRQINLMMMLRNYLMQVGTVYTKRTINETLVRRAAVTRALFDVFAARFDPAADARDRSRKVAAKESLLADAMLEIDNLTEDRIYKRLLNLIRAAVRTNYYQEPLGDVIAIKFTSGEIDELPRPRPLYEIYVHGALMEGIHLRGGRIARGGIRYSDRPDDFRTEVLGLMDTQMKKNALIVPVGSKGGFVVKNLAPYEGDLRKAGDAQYEVFMRALISVTDNLAGSRVVPPKQVVRHDGDDPYLVVAADKGTAHLSDTANEIAVETGCWLADAFASGGSNGFDHKEIGITARGAWESVKRHFWEMGTDLNKESITVVGIGDMSGDVFGNGMLLNRRMKLVGAFNHMHIFLDPDPDPAVSFQERQRLFRLPRSAWSDYAPGKISKGGGVFLRSSKSIALSPRVRELLKSEKREMSGEETIRALLALDVDLVWNGGIGTYFKAPGETDTEVGDHSNDAVRITTDDFRAKVVGEGGNLGLTQAARIAIDRAGGRLFTDAIDNAGGVHMSDQEVNLKILLREVLAAGKLKDLNARNKLLRKLEGAITDVVIQRDYLQAIALAMDYLRSTSDMQPFLRSVEKLAGAGRLDRRAEHIPNAQQFAQFQALGTGMPRPILSVLLSGVKMLLFEELEASNLLDEPFLRKFYFEYFPEALRKSYDLSRLKHPLERQIKCTVITNTVVDQAGQTFVQETAAYTGRSWPDVVGAYLVADEVCGINQIRSRIYALDYHMPAQEQYALLMRLEDFLADFARSILLHSAAVKLAFGEISTLRRQLEDFQRVIRRIAGSGIQADVKAEAKRIAGHGLPPAIAEQIAWLPHMKGFLDISRLASASRVSAAQVIALAQAMDAKFQFTGLKKLLAHMPAGDAWESQLREGLQRSLAKQRQGIIGKILKTGKGAPEDRVAAFLHSCGAAWTEYDDTLNRVLNQSEPELVAVAVLVGALEKL